MLSAHTAPLSTAGAPRPSYPFSTVGDTVLYAENCKDQKEGPHGTLSPLRAQQRWVLCWGNHGTEGTCHLLRVPTEPTTSWDMSRGTTMAGSSPPKSPMQPRMHALLNSPSMVGFCGARPHPQATPNAPPKSAAVQKRALPLNILQPYREEGSLINQSIFNGRERLASLPGMLSGPSPVAIGMATVAKETASMATHPWMRVLGDLRGRTHPSPGLCFPGGVVGKGMAPQGDKV